MREMVQRGVIAPQSAVYFSSIKLQFISKLEVHMQDGIIEPQSLNTSSVAICTFLLSL